VGAYSAPLDPLAAFDGLTSKRGEWRGGLKRREEKGSRDATHSVMANS